MSFILDALKKSEQDRERQQQPALAEIPYGRRNRSQPWWLMGVLGLLLLNCILLLVMWWRSDHAAAVVQVNAPLTTTVSSSSSASSKAVTITVPRAAEVRPLQDEAGNETEPPVDETSTALAADTLSGPPLVRPATGLEQAMAQQESMANRLKANSPGALNSSNADNLPTLASLGGNGALNLPDMRLDVHVYSSNAAERFAFINSHKYVEGQNLNEGPHLDAITKDGVILTYRNQRFLLPRQ
jgi:general secretion pathway protein B